MMIGDSNRIDKKIFKIVGNGPVANIIGAITSIITMIIAFIILTFFGFVTLNDYNIRKNYILTTATVIEETGAKQYTIKYNIDNNEYTNTLFDAEQYNVGDTVNIYYNPDDYNYITYVPQEITFTSNFLPIIFAIFFIIIGFISTKKHFNNFMFYINPQKYKLDNSFSDSTSINVNDNEFSIDAGFNESDLDDDNFKKNL